MSALLQKIGIGNEWLQITFLLAPHGGQPT